MVSAGFASLETLSARARNLEEAILTRRDLSQTGCRIVLALMGIASLGLLTIGLTGFDSFDTGWIR